MPISEIAGATGHNLSRAGNLASAVSKQVAPVGASAKPAAPTYLANAVAQPSRNDAAAKKDTNRSLILQSQSLAIARQEEIRLQQKLASLRESILESENRLREMQLAEISPRKH